MNLLSWIGRQTIELFSTLGFFSIVGLRTFSGVFTGTWSKEDLFEQLERVGVGSVLVVSITSAFTVWSLQSRHLTSSFFVPRYIGGVIARAWSG